MAHDLAHPGADPACPTCGGSGLRVAPVGEVARAQACPCVKACPLCRDTGFVPLGGDRTAPRQRCRCAEVKRRWALLDAATLPARHADSTRASFVPQDKLQTSIVAAVSKYVQDFEPPRDGRETKGLLLWGDVGRGKTHLLVALVRELVLRHGVSARFVEFSHLLADLKTGFDGGRGAGELLDPLVRVDVLAIDELGKGRNTEFEGTVIDELVSRRYNAMRPILATTNFPPTAPTGRKVANAAEALLRPDAPPPMPSLPDRLGERVWSRLAETCLLVEVRGEDYRQRRRAAPPRPG